MSPCGLRRYGCNTGWKSRSGLNTINNIVDFTNLVMAELGQPTHAFDRDLLSGDTIYIRPARSGEQIVALNDETYSLDTANLVIADKRGPVAIAGVIGGKETAIGPGTTSIVLESACFQAASIRKTSSQIKLRTDASMRFEKSQDPANTVRALARAQLNCSRSYRRGFGRWVASPTAGLRVRNQRRSFFHRIGCGANSAWM